jgi:hypothetical protein
MLKKNKEKHSAKINLIPCRKFDKVKRLILPHRRSQTWFLFSDLSSTLNQK